MRIVFERGWGPYAAGRVFDLPEPLAQVHVALGRAKAAPDGEAPAAVRTSAPAAKPARAGRKG